jgi:two-component system, LytTR family, response regulator
MTGDLTVLLVDDEPVIRRGLRRLLDQEAGVSVVGEARNGREALELVDALDPDLLFLDVRMPEVDGLEVARTLGAGGRPGIVFVTAYDRYAVAAFEHHAIDYLLKPFDDVRVRTALTRARDRLARPGAAALGARMRSLLEQLSGPEQRFVVRVGRKVRLIDPDEVDWIEAADNYVRLHAGEGRHVVRETLRDLERRLGGGRFVRIHRSAMVNVSRVKELVAQPGGDYTVLLTTGDRLRLSRRYRERFEALIGRAL